MISSAGNLHTIIQWLQAQKESLPTASHDQAETKDLRSKVWREMQPDPRGMLNL